MWHGGEAAGQRRTSTLAPFCTQGSRVGALGGFQPHTAHGAMPDSRFLFQALGQVDKELGITLHTTLNPAAKSLSPPRTSAPLLSLTLGLAAAFFLRLH